MEGKNSERDERALGGKGVQSQMMLESETQWAHTKRKTKDNE